MNNNATDIQIDINITDSARDHIRKFLDPMGKEAGFRFGAKKSGCSGYKHIREAAEKPQADELCIIRNDIRIFVIKDSIPQIQGTLIDLIEKDFGQKQLVFNNKNQQDACGCGESFTIKTQEDN